jgi:Flp pilus assembly protein TadD
MRIDHIAFRVRDRAGAVRFLCDALGYRIQQEFPIYFDEAKTEYRRYLKAQPQDAVFLNNLAFLMADTNEDLNQAQQFSEEALRASPAHPDYLDTLAIVHLKKNNTGAAIQILTNLTGKYSKNPAFRYHLGLAWLKSGAPDKARMELNAALALGLPAKDAKEARNLLRN